MESSIALVRLGADAEPRPQHPAAGPASVADQEEQKASAGAGAGNRVIFHIQPEHEHEHGIDGDGAKWKQQASSDPRHGADHADAAAAAGAVPPVVSRSLSPSRPLSDDFARALDPLDTSVTRAVLESWPESKLSELAALVTPEEGLTVLLNKMMGAAHHNTLSFRDVSHTVKDQNGQQAHVLRSVSGLIRSGELVGLLGASDAGVSSLLRILAGRVELNEEASPSNRLRRWLHRAEGTLADGHVWFNGEPRHESFRQDVGFLVRDDPNLSLLSVWETLLFSASLRQLPVFSPKLLRFLVSLVMSLLGLSHIRDSLVGDVVSRGISGGELRRLSMGCELVAGHHMILADLPTNGLDSHSAASLFRAVKCASLSGRAMMASVVQPTQELFDMFDRIVLLCKGSMIFQGRPGDAEAHFNAAGFHRPPGKTVPSWLEEMSATPEKFWRADQQQQQQQRDTSATMPQRSPHASASPATVTDELARASDARRAAWQVLEQAYAQSRFHKEVMEAIAHTVDNPQHTPQSQRTQAVSEQAPGADVDHIARAPGAHVARDREAPLQFPLGTGQYRISFPQQLRLVLHRHLLLLKRNRSLWAGFWVQSVVLGLLLGSLFYQLGTDQREVRVRFGLFWFIIMSQSFGSAQMLPALCSQRHTYYHQIHSRYFSPAAYYLATALPQLPIGLIQAMLLATILYPMSGLINGLGSAEYWCMCVLLVLVNWTARGFVMLVSSISPSELIAQMLIPIATLLFSAMSGFMNPKDAIPAGWRWLNTASYFTYTLRGLSLNENKHLDWSCAAGQPCPYPTSDAVLDLYSMNADFSQRWTDAQSLVWFWLAFHSAAMLCYWIVDWSAKEPTEVPGFEVYADEETDEADEPLAAKVPLVQDIESGHGKADGVDYDAATRSAQAASTPLPVSITPSAAVSSASASPAAAIVPSPVCLEWRALGYSVPVPPPKGVSRHAAPSTSRTLLHDISGFAKPGTLIALMGASGAGKTTLLDLLSLKKTGGVMSGEVLLNGVPVDRATFARISAYVEQQESHDPLSTIRESLEFSARLRLPRATSESELQRSVQHAMHVLNLTHLQNERIGTVEGGGLTAAIRKKVSIAVELVANPRVLFLDEPTTGLDSTGAHSVMSIVRDLSRHRTVICTIHQPTQETLNLFDALYLLEQGRLVYFGPLTQVVAYIEQQGWAAQAQSAAAGHTTADIAITGVKHGRSLTDASTGAKVDVVRAFQQSPQYAWVQQSVLDMQRDFGLLAQSSSGADLPAAGAATSSALSTRSQPEYPGVLTQFRCLVGRFLRSHVRDRLSSGSRVVMALFFSFVVSTLFADLSLGQQAGANRIALLFMIIMFPIVTAVLKLPQYLAARSVYFREHGSQMYGPMPYAMARWMAEIPLIVLELLLLSVIVYFSTGLTRADAGLPFAVFLGTLLTVRLQTFSYVELMAALVANPAMATAVTLMPIIICMLFAGFLIPEHAMPEGWLWMSYLSMIRYPLELLAANELRFLDFTCAPSMLMPAPSGYNVCPLPASSSGRKCPLQCGSELLSQFGMESSSDGMWLNYFVIVIFMVGFRILGYAALRFINHIKR